MFVARSFSRFGAASTTTTNKCPTTLLFSRLASSSSAQPPQSPPTSTAKPTPPAMNRLKISLTRPEKLSVLYRPSKGIAPQIYDWFLVTDLVATVVHRAKFDAFNIPSQEIINIPVAKLNAKTFEIEAEFDQMVLPIRKPVLDAFCTEQTGITQAMLEGQPLLPAALTAFNEWLIAQNLITAGENPIPQSNWIFATDSDWDLGMALANDANIIGTPLPAYFSKWIDVNVAFSEAYKRNSPSTLTLLMALLQLRPSGRLRGGMEEVRHICSVMKTIAENAGYVYHPTSLRQI